ncbi:MAG: GHMP kinase [Bacteroidetes bacterium]|nr:GHMP kinase [Bacteroidota bacterium]
MKTKEYYSNGKLLISGEYFVLNGALALAVPVKFGQFLEVTESDNTEIINWKSFENNKLWFTANFRKNNFEILSSNDREIAKNLSEIFSIASTYNNNFLRTTVGLQVNSNLNFNRKFGLGSSSTLISNIAYWADVDPYKLNEQAFKGSGYDIACARSNKPILYQLKNELPEQFDVSFIPDFNGNIYFVYLGKKQSSLKSINDFRRHYEHDAKTIDLISELTKELAFAKRLDDFEKAIVEHETIVSKAIKKKRIKDSYFSDFEGEIKSLGAWGGDFIMVTSNLSYDKVMEYFKKRKLKIIYSFDEMVKNG